MSCAAVLLVRLPPPLPALHPGKRGGYKVPFQGNASQIFFSPPAFPGEARVAGGPVLPEERPRMTPPLLQCDLCLSVRASEKNKGK